MERGGGFTIVLTADATLMADYRLLFDGILAANQTTAAPRFFIRRLLTRTPKNPGIRAKVAPLGLRRIEAALLRSGFAPDEVAVVHPDRLRDAIGPQTRIVAATTAEPLGLGMATTTTRAIAGGMTYPAAEFRRLIRRTRRAADRAGAAVEVVAGGPGAWQLATRDDSRRRLGIDHVVLGYAEGNVAPVFSALLRGERLPEHIEGQGVAAAEIPPIVGASTMGVVEISRGCGLGCAFCTIARTPIQHLPEATVLADAQTNVAHGVCDVCVISEDLLRYGARGARTNPAAVISLLESLRRIDGIRLIQTDHANIASTAQYTDGELAQVRNLLTGRTGQRYPWVNIGVETASGELLKANGCGAKMGGCSADEWPGVCAEQLKRLCRAGFLPLASIVVGLPGESEADVRRMTEWVRALSGEPIVVFPILYAPIDGSAPLGASDLTRAQWDLLRTCYRTGFEWIPRLYWDSECAVRVPWGQRALMQVLGAAQAALWKTLLAWRAGRSRNGRTR